MVGSVALDTVETPHGSVRDALGGSAVYFSVAARLLSPVSLVGVVGNDFPKEHLDMLTQLGIDTKGLQVKNGKTFRWWGRYSEDMNDRETVEVELNVFGDFQPEIPKEYTGAEFVFLANGSPVTQATVLDQIGAPKFTVADTMDLWIKTTREELLELMARLDALILNDSEVRLLTGKTNTIAAARDVLKMGPRMVIVKKGEHGAFLMSDDDLFSIPAFPCELVYDPTGAGDSFAGGMMGCLAKENSASRESLRRGLAYGTVMASFGVEQFGPARFLDLTVEDVDRRLSEFRGMLSF